ncbi:hypothetical protein BN2476_170151 [Paraburkholderia piptadeniae]|uniref:Uncharacterized protein n=2 Tax=Paraburkholderia piptadeniae TaxID=1701573 RepID=A0A1N7RTQ5_9BURK|nr:hypothetical protein BN2476_170151 [Paraburkholderia piptadeniae]
MARQMIGKGKTGKIHGIEVKPRDHVQEPTVQILTASATDRSELLRAAKKVYEQHKDVIRALANR